MPDAPHGIRLDAYNGDPDRDILDHLNRLIEAGPFHLHVARNFPLAQAADAHRALGEHYLGKLALRIG